RPLIETEPSDDQVLPAIPAQRFFNLAGLEIRAVQDCDLLVRVSRKNLFNRIGYIQRFVFTVRSFVEPDLRSGSRIRPKPFPLAYFVIGDKGAGRFENVLGRTVVLLQANDFGVREVL